MTDNAPSQSSPAISVVVIGRNEGERLVRCLRSIQDSNYDGEVELIYVDSDSTDDSVASATALGARVIEVKPDRPAAAIGRNAGWRAARHSLVHFFDGDTIVDPDWFGKAADAIADPNVACVFGRRDELAISTSIYNFWAHHDWYVPPGPADSCAGDAMFRRDILERCGGYDEGLIAGEEPDLCYRIRTGRNMTILSLDEPMTQHDMNMTRFGQYWRRCVRTGHAYAEVGGRNAGMHRWRKNRWRNLFYAIGTPGAVLVSLILWSPWPIILWLLLLAAAVTRNALRLKPRVGTMGAALAYSAHHYLAKTPTALGQCIFWVRSWLKRGPQRLIEYRT